MRDGPALQAARKRLNLKQTELAPICSLRAETLSRIENGHEPVPGYVDLILDFLELYGEPAISHACRKHNVRRSIKHYEPGTLGGG
jgi:transcriptional regulator with XRE-family HTH domain